MLQAVVIDMGKLRQSDLHGFKYFKMLDELLGRFSKLGCERDKADNRQLHGDQYMALRKMLEPGRLYVFDRGSQDYALYRNILDAQSSFIGRVKDNIAYNRQQEQELTEEARKAGVIRDTLVSRIGTDRLSVRAIGGLGA
jgi:hypothetical protein